jgi:hypothetical protein
MIAKRLLLVGAGAIVVTSAIIGFNWWFNQALEQEVLTISASEEPDLGIPIFAQFDITQTINLPHEARVSRLVIPVSIPDKASVVQIDLRRFGTLVQRWRYPLPPAPLEPGIHHLSLSLQPPQLLDKDLEVNLSAREVTHDDKDRAVRVFVETAGNNYPDGNYRIAHNEKQGDIGLHFYETLRQGDQYLAKWKKQPWLEGSRSAKWLLIPLLILPLFYLKKIVVRPLG